MKPQQQQINVSEQDTTPTVCPCGCDLFDVAYRHRVLPGLSLKNPSGHDMPIKVEVFICRECGCEMGKDGLDEKLKREAAYISKGSTIGGK